MRLHMTFNAAALIPGRKAYHYCLATDRGLRSTLVQGYCSRYPASYLSRRATFMSKTNRAFLLVVLAVASIALTLGISGCKSNANSGQQRAEPAGAGRSVAESCRRQPAPGRWLPGACSEQPAQQTIGSLRGAATRAAELPAACSIRRATSRPRSGQTISNRRSRIRTISSRRPTRGKPIPITVMTPP